MKNQSSHKLSADCMPFPETLAPGILLDIVDQTFLLIDTNFNIITANDFVIRKTKEFTGITLETGNCILDFAPKEALESIKQVYSKVFRGEIIHTTREIFKDGKKYEFEIELKPAFYNEQIIGAAVFAKDITDDKVSKEQLRAAEERWRFALEGSSQGVWDWDLKTDEIFYSNSYRKLYGFSETDLLHTVDDWKSLIHPDDKERVEQDVKAHVSSKDPFYETHYRIKTKDGNYKWILARGMLMDFDNDGVPCRMIGTHTDITNQVQAEEKLRISEQQYKGLFQFNPLPCWIYDAETSLFTAINEATVQQYGYTKEELIGSSVYIIHPAKEYNKLHERLVEERYQKSISRSNWIHKKKNGENIYVDLKINTITYNGREARLVVAHNVTDKVKIENELRQSNERFLYASQASSEALWEWDFETEEFYVSDVYTAIFGWTSNDQRSFAQWESFIHPDDRKETIESYFAALQNKSVERWTKEYRYQKSDGSYAHVIDKAIILRKENGEPKKIVGAIQNISIRKKAEEEIRKSNERFDIVMQATHDLIWDWDLETNNIYRERFGLNKVYGVVDNTDIENIYSWTDRVHPDDRERAQSMITEIMQSKEPKTFEMEYRFLRDDGTYSYVYDRGKIILNAEGKAVRMIGAAQDITLRKLLEQELLQTELEKQKAINQATVDTQEQERSEIGKELHDNVNQVLTTTKLYLDLALSSPELKDELLLKSKRNIINVINEIRQLSRSLMDPTIGDLGLIESISDLIANINLTGKLEVHFHAPEQLDDLLNKNQKLTVFRIIQESLNNALKHANANTVFINLTSSKEEVHLKIVDDGVGFNPALIKRGAGLKNIENRVYLINGTQTIKTSPGKGCQILIKFPIVKHLSETPN